MTAALPAGEQVDAETLLPPGFVDLLPFVDWASATSPAQRYLRRQITPFAELVAFHEAMAPRLAEIFDCLDRYPLGALPAAEARLFAMTLGLAETAQAVELFGQPGIPHMSKLHHVDIRRIESGPDI